MAVFKHSEKANSFTRSASLTNSERGPSSSERSTAQTLVGQKGALVNPD